MIAPAWYGVKAFRILTAADRALPRVAEHIATGKTGKQILDDTFTVILPLVRKSDAVIAADVSRETVSKMTSGAAQSLRWR